MGSRCAFCRLTREAQAAALLELVEMEELERLEALERTRRTVCRAGREEIAVRLVALAHGSSPTVPTSPHTLH